MHTTDSDRRHYFKCKTIRLRTMSLGRILNRKRLLTCGRNHFVPFHKQGGNLYSLANNKQL